MTKLLYILATTLSVLIAMATLRALPLGLETAFLEMAEHINQRRGFFLLHIVAASIALLCGAPQFSTKIRQRWLGLHRWTGRFYVIAVMAAAVGGMSLALNAIAGPVAVWGFGLLSIFWAITTGVALWHIRAHRISQHKNWIIRSYALTFAAVTLRLQLAGLIFGMGMNYEQASLILAWSCWIPNLILAEWWIAHKKRPERPSRPLESFN